MKLNTLIILAFTFGIGSLAAQAQIPCTQKFEIQNLKKSNGKGSFDLKLESKDIYSGQLVEIKGTDQSLIQIFSGEGDLKQAFKNLKNSYYRVILEFKNEPKFLCKKRVLTVDLTDSK